MQEDNLKELRKEIEEGNLDSLFNGLVLKKVLKKKKPKR